MNMLSSNILFRLYAMLLIIAGTLILQYHSIQFWTLYVDREIGWLWSMLIEAVAFWMWFRRDVEGRVMGAIASMLLLAGPIFQLASPAIEHSGQQRAAQFAEEQRVGQLRNQIEQDAQLLRTFSSNSQSRTGWLVPIEQTQERLENARSELYKILQSKSVNIRAISTSTYFLLLLEIFALVLVQISNVMAINYIALTSGLTHGVSQFEEDDFLPHAQDCDGHNIITSLQSRVKVLMAEDSLSISSAARRLQVDRHNLSYLLRYQTEMDRRPAQKILTRLSKLFTP